MKRFLPRTLFARMVLVLLGGLIAAQFLSFAVHWRERGEFVMRTAGLHSAERVADIIKLLDATPVGRVGTAMDIALAAQFLCSDAASFISGTDLLVDGGGTAGMKLSMGRG